MSIKNKYFMSALLTVIGLALSYSSPSNVYAATPIPAGCPGSSIQGPPSIDCSKIPAGCPGSTQQASNPRQADRTPSNCPYSAPAGSSTGSGGANCASSGTCADCSSPSSSAEGCIDCSPDGSACQDSATRESCDKDSCDFVSKVLNPLIVLLSGLVGLAVALSIIVGSIQYSSSAGDPQKAAKGRDRIKNAIIALIAYIFLFAFLNFIIPGGLV